MKGSIRAIHAATANPAARIAKEAPMSSMPRQVLAAAADAEAQVRTMRAAAEPPADPPPVAEPPAPPAAPPAEVVDWKARHDVAAHRLNVTEGITRTQGAEIRDLRAQVEKLKADLDAAKAAPATPPPDLSEYDPKLVDVVEHLAEKRLAPLRQKVEQAAADAERRKAAEDLEAKKAQFASDLDEWAPKNWHEIDVDPDFSAYLAGFDASGKQRQAAYMDAFRKLDGMAMACIFKRYVDQKVVAPPPVPPIVPPPSGRETRVDPPQGKLWTQAEINEFYDGTLKGRKTFLGRSGWTKADIDATEKDILAAYREGRVRA